jgi:hypothetical protein
MPVTLIEPDTLVTAEDWWNPVSQLVNTIEANLATEITNRANGDSSINNRLNSTIAGGGISDLPTWKTSVDGTNTTQNTSITALNTAVEMPYSGTSISDRLTALEAAAPGAIVSDTQITSGTTTSTTYTPTLTGGVTCGVAFTASSSGKAIVDWETQMSQSAALYVYATIEVRAGATIGSGTIILATNDNDCAFRYGSGAGRQAVFKHVTGLTAGSSYNVRMLFRVDSDTGSYTRKALMVSPG